MDALFKKLQQHFPTPVALVLSILCWPLANLAKVIPQILETLLQNKIESRKMKIAEEKWEIQKDKLLMKVDTLIEKNLELENQHTTVNEKVE